MYSEGRTPNLSRNALASPVRLNLYLDMLNLFNRTSILAYYNYYPPVDPAAWEIRGDPTGGPGINRPVTPEGTSLYDIPRELHSGMRLEL